MAISPLSNSSYLGPPISHQKKKDECAVMVLRSSELGGADERESAIGLKIELV
jgi:hypothetical protein